LLLRYGGVCKDARAAVPEEGIRNRLVQAVRKENKLKSSEFKLVVKPVWVE
jgi:hypothetical protein